MLKIVLTLTMLIAAAYSFDTRPPKDIPVIDVTYTYNTY